MLDCHCEIGVNSFLFEIRLETDKKQKEGGRRRKKERRKDGRGGLRIVEIELEESIYGRLRKRRKDWKGGRETERKSK